MVALENLDLAVLVRVQTGQREMKDIVCIILAAGRSTRLKEDLPKVCQSILGRPMLSYVIEAVKNTGIKEVFVIIGYKRDLVRKILPERIDCIIQERPLGTADAVRRTEERLKEYKGDVLVVYGDHPFLRSQTLKELVSYHKRGLFDCTLLIACLEDPSGYGRVIRNGNNQITGILEESDCSREELKIKEVNSGVLCFKSKALFEGLKEIKINERKREFYLTDIIKILSKKGKKIGSLESESPEEEGLGVNKREELIKATELTREKKMSELISKGVRIISPETTFIDFNVLIGKDTTIYPFTVIERNVKIGKNCQIGPFCHIREGVVIRDNAQVGNFVEIVRSEIDKDCKIKHFSYLGDVRIGRNVNVGAGVVTANFNGKRKNITRIRDGAFIGSDTVFIAPVRVGKNAVTGAGAIVTKNQDIPDNAVVVGVPAKILKKVKGRS